MGAAVVRAFARQAAPRLQGIVAVDGLLYVSPAMLQAVAPFANRFDSPEFEQMMKSMVESFFVESLSLFGRFSSIISWLTSIQKN